MTTKAECLEALDEIEKGIGHVIDALTLADKESLPLRQARIHYAEGGLWLRYWMEQIP
jgi:hypothetical protein